MRMMGDSDNSFWKYFYDCMKSKGWTGVSSWDEFLYAAGACFGCVSSILAALKLGPKAISGPDCANCIDAIGLFGYFMEALDCLEYAKKKSNLKDGSPPPRPRPPLNPGNPMDPGRPIPQSIP